MRLLADENVEGEVVTALRLAGHEVNDVKENTPGIEDMDVLALANKIGAVLLTNDKDFGELIYRDRLATRGVILLRFGKIQIAEKVDLLLSVLEDRESDLIESFTVITSNGIRMRR
jgi:predicted nuclease of predicted toxin-antitoxin system